VVNDNGSIRIISDSAYPDLNFYREWEYFEQKNVVDDNTVLWLYEPQYPSVDDSGNEGGSTGGDGGNTGGSSLYTEKKALYDILHAGIEYDYSAYTVASYEALLDALEDGIAVYKKADATAAELTAATAVIRTAINALKMDVKKINGTLFKYGYNNSSTDDAKYADGDAFALQADLEKASGVSVPAPIVGLEHRPILHKNVCEKTEIKEVVKNWLR
jgi:hypothetical protein